MNITGELRKNDYDQEYKVALFYDWYNAGRPSITKFYPQVKEDAQGIRPSKETVRHWIYEDFKEQADFLDKQITDEMNRRMIEVKIEMLSRHAQLGLDLQTRALDELRNIDKLSEAGAIRLLEFSVKLEHECRGIPEMLSKIAKMKDNDLMKEINELVTKSSTLQLEAEIDE